VIDEVLNSVARRKLLTGLGTVAIGGAAASLVGRTALGDAERHKMDAVAPSVCVFRVASSIFSSGASARTV
jgi:hypothetical protein